MKTSIQIALIICGSGLMALPLIAYCSGMFPKDGYDAISLLIILFPLVMGFIMVCLGAMQEAGEAQSRKRQCDIGVGEI